MSEHIEIYDSTLRDGAQAEGISYSLEDKLLIARRLDRLGVHYIEGGWPNSTNPKDLAFFEQVKDFGLRAKITAFGSTRCVLFLVTKLTKGALMVTFSKSIKCSS